MAAAEQAKKDAKNRKKRKKNKVRNGLGEDKKIYENIKIIPKTASRRDIMFIIDSLFKHFFFQTLSNEEMYAIIQAERA